MTLEGTPWFTDKAAHGPEIARALAYMAAGGQGGIVGTADFKVTASAIPDRVIHVAPGTIAAVNAGEGAASQAYVGRNIGDHAKTLTAQGASGTRWDMVAYVVHDPQYAGQPQPPNVTSGPYDEIKVYEGVASTARFLTDVDSSQTGEALALVKFDASDGTITTADITDLRRLVLARSEVAVRMNTVTSGTGAMSTGAPTVFPSGATWTVLVPKWATTVALECLVSGVDLTDSGSAVGTASGTVQVELGALTSPTGTWRADATGAGKRTTTMFQAGEDGIAVPLAMRGQNATLRIRCAKTGGTGLTAQWASGLTAIARATFAEKPI